jgi:hypothetical protein
MTTLFQPFVAGPAIGGWNGKFYSKRVFLTRERAEAYLPEFVAKCLDPKPFDALQSVEIAKILELELDDKVHV